MKVSELISYLSSHPGTEDADVYLRINTDSDPDAPLVFAPSTSAYQILNKETSKCAAVVLEGVVKKETNSDDRD